MLAPPTRTFVPWSSASPWTDERVELLKVLWANDSSCSYIADQLGGGITRNAVIGKATRLGLPKRRESYVRKTNRAADKDRSATMRIKTLRVRGPSHGGTVVVESVVREEAPGLTEFNAAIPQEQRRTLVQLTDKTCHFPCGDVGEPDFFFCGAAIPGHAVYCGYHALICYQAAPRPVERPYLPTGGAKLRVF